MTSLSSRACHSAICRTSSGTWRIRARATTGGRFSQSVRRASASLFQSVAPLSSGCGNWIAACLPWQRRLPTARIERTQSQRALLAVGTFLSSPYRGRVWRLILQIFAGSQVLTAGKCFPFLSALVQYPQKSDGGITHGFGFAPVSFLSSFALCHVRNMQHRSVQSHGKNHRNHG
jgi:hypothetical protein